MTNSPASRARRHAARAPGIAAAVIVVLALLLAWTAWSNATLREQLAASQQRNDALQQSLRDALASRAPPAAPAAAPGSTFPSAPSPAAAAAAPGPADPLAPLAAPARAASGPSLERALETLRERAPAPRTSPFGAGTGS